MTPTGVLELAQLAPAQREAAEALFLLRDERERRAAMSGRSIEAFAYRYLRDQFALAPGDFHRELYGDLDAVLHRRPVTITQRKRRRREAAAAGEGLPPARVVDSMAYAYPRGHGKTTTMLGLILHCVYNWQRLEHFRDPDTGKHVPPFILIVSDTVGQARDRALDVRDEIETNHLLREDYGNLVPDQRRRWAPAEAEYPDVEPEDYADAPGGSCKWTETDFTTATGVRVMAVGSGSKVRGLLRKGRRPTLIVMDDMENDQHVNTLEQRNKLTRWVMKALIPTGLEGKLLTILVGTILHADSVLSRLLDPDQYSGWLKRRYAAQTTEDGTPSVDGTIALWPEQWSIARLAARREKIGSTAYAQEYLNIAVDEATTLFRLAWLDAATERGKGKPFLYGPAPRIPFHVAVQTWDPLELARHAGAGAYQLQVTAWDVGIVDDERKARERDTDYTVGLTALLDVVDRVHVARVWRGRGLTPGKLQQRVILEQQLLRSDYVAIENNQAQRIHEYQLRERGLPIIGHTTTTRKHSVYEGVPGMALLFELNRIDVWHASEPERDRVATLKSELHGLGLEAHDDTVMALWFAVSVIRRWMRQRDRKRLELIGSPPAGHVSTFPVREQNTGRKAA